MQHITVCECLLFFSICLRNIIILYKIIYMYTILLDCVLDGVLLIHIILLFKYKNQMFKNVISINKFVINMATNDYNVIFTISYLYK